MKKRNGFVSNSSSSSFVCTVCDEDYSGMDMGLRDFDLRQCECGHIFCDSHYDYDIADNITKDIYLKSLNTKYDWVKTIAEKVKNMSDEEFEQHKQESDSLYDLSVYNVPKELCPVCNPSKLKSESLETLKKNISNKLKFYNNIQKNY